MTKNDIIMSLVQEAMSCLEQIEETLEPPALDEPLSEGPPARAVAESRPESRRGTKIRTPTSP